jgi:hypothetical protein
MSAAVWHEKQWTDTPAEQRERSGAGPGAMPAGGAVKAVPGGPGDGSAAAFPGGSPGGLRDASRGASPGVSPGEPAAEAVRGIAGVIDVLADAAG